MGRTMSSQLRLALQTFEGRCDAKARVSSSAGDLATKGNTGCSLKSVLTYPKRVKEMLFPWNDFQICSRAKTKPQYPGAGL